MGRVNADDIELPHPAAILRITPLRRAHNEVRLGVEVSLQDSREAGQDDVFHNGTELVREIAPLPVHIPALGARLSPALRAGDFFGERGFGFRYVMRPMPITGSAQTLSATRTVLKRPALAS